MPEHLCKKFYNIFHWSDPVAYRMEPLLEKGYSKIEPVLIPPHGGDSHIDQIQPSSMTNGDQSNPQSGNTFSKFFFYLYNHYISMNLRKLFFSCSRY